MKNNFYLQHPLMAVKDPRMKNLIKNEKLRGIGAYWFIMEKLGMLPGQRAELEDIRPFCNQDIPFSYLKKIICGYQLFTFDEEGFFTPEELNLIPEKAAKKSAKKVRESTKSQPKNDENRQKVSRIQANPRKEEIAKPLDNGYLAENDLNIKENIKDRITTAATTEEKEGTAADAVCPTESSSGGGQQPPVTHCPAITPCDDSGRPQPPLRPVRPWQELADGLLNENSTWLEIAYMRSGYGRLLQRYLKQAVKIFKQHIEAYGKGGDMLQMRDIQSYFINYVSAGSRTSRALRDTLAALDAKERADCPDEGDPYRFEQTNNGQRTYQGCPIPADAPPRPDETAYWEEERHVWITGKRGCVKTDKRTQITPITQTTHPSSGNDTSHRPE